MERDRFEFLVKRDGLAQALVFERENVLKTYRRAVLAKRTLNRRALITHYLDAKRILNEYTPFAIVARMIRESE